MKKASFSCILDRHFYSAVSVLGAKAKYEQKTKNGRS